MTAEFHDPREIVDHDVPSWHDGNLVSLAFTSAFTGEQLPDVVILADLYPAEGAEVPRFSFQIVGKRVRRFHMHGDLSRLMDNSKPGNIRWSDFDFSATTETLIINCFGGHIELEADMFTIADQKNENLAQYRKATTVRQKVQ